MAQVPACCQICASCHPHRIPSSKKQDMPISTQPSNPAHARLLPRVCMAPGGSHNTIKTTKNNRPWHPAQHGLQLPLLHLPGDQPLASAMRCHCSCVMCSRLAACWMSPLGGTPCTGSGMGPLQPAGRQARAQAQPGHTSSSSVGSRRGGMRSMLPSVLLSKPGWLPVLLRFVLPPAMPPRWHQ